MYQTTHMEPASTQPTQHAAVWDIRGGLLHQTPVTFPTIPSTNSTRPRASEGGYPFVGAQPVGIYTAQPQVSPAVVSSVVLT